MAYQVFNAEGELSAGDDVFDDVLKAAALLTNGWVEDADGRVVYESPARRAALEEQAAQEDEPETIADTLTGVVTPPDA
jgi:hypothetical protein